MKSQLTIFVPLISFISFAVGAAEPRVRTQTASAVNEGLPAWACQMAKDEAIEKANSANTDFLNRTCSGGYTIHSSNAVGAQSSRATQGGHMIQCTVTVEVTYRYNCKSDLASAPQPAPAPESAPSGPSVSSSAETFRMQMRETAILLGLPFCRVETLRPESVQKWIARGYVIPEGAIDRPTEVFFSQGRDGRFEAKDYFESLDSSPQEIAQAKKRAIERCINAEFNRECFCESWKWDGLKGSPKKSAK